MGSVPSKATRANSACPGVSSTPSQSQKPMKLRGTSTRSVLDVRRAIASARSFCSFRIWAVGSLIVYRHGYLVKLADNLDGARDLVERSLGELRLHLRERLAQERDPHDSEVMLDACVLFSDSRRQLLVAGHTRAVPLDRARRHPPLARSGPVTKDDGVS